MSTNETKQVQDVEVFIGARNLKDQIGLIMPTYDLMLEHIETIRQAATKTKVKENCDDTEIELEYSREINNTIGVFGARGTGKSSAIHTVRAYLNDRVRRDLNVILPIIEPDNFGQNTKIMGSIIGLLEQKVNKLLNKIEKKTTREDKEEKLSEFFNNCVYRQNNPLRSKMNELIEYHLYTESEYRTLLTQNYADLATHIRKSSRMLIPDIEFKRKLHMLVNELIKTQKAFGSSKLDEEILIFIFIDDIDLKTIKTRELIESILQYANHPNIVTVLSGDYDIFAESLTTALLQDENLQQSNLRPGMRFRDGGLESLEGRELSQEEEERNPTILQRKWNLSHEYLKKLIPPARRHQLVNWNNNTIPLFSFGDLKFMTQLSQLMGDDSLFSYEVQFSEGKQSVERPIKSSYVIFDKKPRGLVNVYYHVHQINKLKASAEYQQLPTAEQQQKLFQSVKALIDTIIMSSTHLAAKQREFMDQIFRWGDQAQSTFIEYGKVQSDNRLPVLILGELIRSLLEDVRYSESEYQTMKQQVFEEMGKHKADVPISDQNINRYQGYYLYYVVLGITAHSKLQSGFLLLDELFSQNAQNEEDIYYTKQAFSPKAIEKERIVFMSIVHVMRQNKTLISDLFSKGYYEENMDVKRSLNFLQELSSTSSQFDFVEKLFHELISGEEQIVKLVEELKKVPLCSIDNEVYHTIIVNTLSKIMLTDSLKENFTSNKDYRALQKINQSKDGEKYSSKTVGQLLQRIYKKIKGYLATQLVNSEIDSLRLSPKFYRGYDAFMNEVRDGENTIYRRVRGVVGRITQYRHKDKLSIDDYKEIFSEVKKLSQNSYVWFGRVEATHFLATLKNEVSFDLDVLFTESSEYPYPHLIREISFYLQEANPAIQQDQQYQEAKRLMRKELEQALEAVKYGVSQELEQLGQSLEDIEPSGDEYDQEN
ncbi:hypothetical protein MKY59_25110 [Paenibacillus sp. FSL W8-0426]|uniref:hypothetical protein n=1 Tax=Paenibacillus sp. FSL W8-0426 TaxID=2921714 RepID=UPI0030D7F0F7